MTAVRHTPKGDCARLSGVERRFGRRSGLGCRPAPEVKMYFQQFYLSCLAHASYMIGSEGIAAVVDPQRDVEIYLEEARQQGLRIAYVIETHLHADFVSGHKELAERTGATICVGAKGGAKFPHRAMK